MGECGGEEIKYKLSSSSVRMCYTAHMQTMVSVVLSYDEEIRQWGAWLPDVAAYGVGASVEEAVASLKEALALYVEEVGKKKFLEEVAPPLQVISLPLGSLV